MSERVERVARALARRSLEKESILSDEKGGWARDKLKWEARPEITDRNWMTYVEDARAAIAAMREPTKAMIDAAEISHIEIDAGDDGYVLVRAEQIKEVWQAMIDEALK